MLPHEVPWPTVRDGLAAPPALNLIEDRSPRGREQTAALERRLGPFDATMIVMGGIIGSGIFINPYVVARQVTSTALILGVWAAVAWGAPALGGGGARVGGLRGAGLPRHAGPPARSP